MAERHQDNHGDRIVTDDFGTADFPLKQHVSPHGRVTAVSMMKDEGPFVLEWIAHHLALGFTDLLVYTNDCTDGTDAMLIRLQQLGLAHHRRNDIPEGMRPQPSALKYAQKDPLVRASDWLIVFDADEFLCIKHGDGSVDGLISSTKQVGGNGVVITWRTFGSAGVQHWSRDPVTEQYQYAAPAMWNKGWGVKTLFQFDPEFWVLGIHRPKIKNKHLKTSFPDSVNWLNGSGLPMEDYFKFRGWRSIVRTVGYDWAQMNHYAVKSIDSYAIRKFRGNVNNKKDKYNADYWALQDRNEVFDDSILRHRDRRDQIMAQLLKDPVLHQLHHAALTLAEARLTEFKNSDAYAALVDGLKAASDVPITQVVAKPPKPRDPAQIAALMSEVEAQRNRRPKSERRHKTHPDWGALGDIYVAGDVDLSQNIAIDHVSNHDLKIPADPRVFRPAALQMIVEGKFERNAARRIPKLLQPGMSYLEVGAGVGFLAGLIARDCPDVQVTAQEDSPALLQIARQLREINGLTSCPNYQILTSPLFTPQDRASADPAFTHLLPASGCNMLVVNDPRIDCDMLARTLSRTTVKPAVVLLGARAMAGALNEASATAALTNLGYGHSAEPPLTTALLMTRE
ncbi:glycosyltransferase family 2 protein [Phaeobacter inhibens]|uniref:glycosyltransferase family 2 protein n=1 Tax=Phaeobacter inhibens TaxID=221822 RepID=UPI000C9ABFD6|nr:glycosyltransferase family 2 protein [Phaeobacter inhibens]AUQ68742.1 Glycosyl transferase family 2 [Phaeobacter inhibens]